MRKYYVFIIILTAFCISLVTAAIITTGSPTQQRARQLDQTRISNLNMISSEVTSYMSLYDKAPESLSELEERTSYITISDPETDQSYDLKWISSSQYQLCATFSTDTTESQDYTGEFGTSKPHKKGYDCISYTVPSYIQNTLKKSPPLAPAQ